MYFILNNLDFVLLFFSDSEIIALQRVESLKK